MEKLQALITVIIPVYNRESIVRRTLDSLAAQTLPCFKTILIDNNSSDNTAAVLKDWAKAHSTALRPVEVLSEATPGAAAARAHGLRHAETDWALFFDSDDIMTPGHLQRVHDGILANPDADVLGWDVRIDHLDGSTRVRRFYDKDLQWHNIVHGGFASQRYCCRRPLLLRAGNWNPEVKFWNDIELGARLIALGPTVRRLGSEITVIVKETETSITGTSHASNLRRAPVALDSIRKWTPECLMPIFTIKMLIEAALAHRQGEPEGKEYLARLLAQTKSRPTALAYRLAFLYTSRGGRGTATLMRPLFPLLRR